MSDVAEDDDTLAENAENMFIRKKIAELIENSGTCLDLASLDYDLVQLPEELFLDFSDEELGKIKEVTVDFNNFLSLPECIGRLKGLLKLSAEGNEITSLPPSTGHLIRLEELRINENHVCELPLSLARLRCLRVVNLAANELRCLPSEIAEGLTLLEELYLDENKVTELPENFGELKSLRILELSENKLSCLPESFGSLSQLQILNLSRNSLTELPGSFGELTRLKKVDLSNNNISALPEKFLSVSVIKDLYLDNNILGILPDWVGSLSSIVHLSLCDNKLQGSPLPQSFPEGAKSTLKTLEAGGNAISNLPETIGELDLLEELHLGSTICELERRNFQNGNWIRDLPESFGWLKALHKLRLDENQLASLPDSFGNLSNLSWLDLGQNLLSYLPNTFCNLESLEFCQLSKNKLVCLPANFGKLVKLIDLRLDQNLIEELPESFSNLKSLHTLDLFDNRLTEVPNWLTLLVSLKRLDLDQNKLKLKLKDIPHLTSKGSEYAHRDPKLKDNWRGKTRADKVKAEVVVISSGDGNNDEDNGEEPVSPAVYNENVLAAAMRRGLSIWKTHTGAEERQTQQAEEINTEEFTLNLFEDNVLDVSSAMNVGFYVKLSQKEGHNEGVADDEEDWDKEISESWEKQFLADGSLSSTVGVEVAHVEVEKRNEFLSLLSSYPPAVQAFSPTATYQSLVFCASNNSVRGLPARQAVFIQGQFDDAD